VLYEKTNLSYPEIISKASALDYQGIELNFKEWPSELNLNEIKKSLDKFNVEVAAIGTRHMYMTHGLYLASPHKDVRERALDYIAECIKISKKLGSPIVQAGWAFQGSILEAPFDVTWRNAVESLKEVGKRSYEHGVYFVVEFACRYNAKLVNTMDAALRMLEEVKCENVLVMADIFHIYMENDPIRETILRAGKKLEYVHLADSERLPPGKGRIDFQRVTNALKKINYTGYMVMEFNPTPNLDEVLKEAGIFIKKLL
jgi:sugar phosphate isomerase/epimerase